MTLMNLQSTCCYNYRSEFHGFFINHDLFQKILIKGLPSGA